MKDQPTKGKVLFCLLQLPDPLEHSELVWRDDVPQKKKDNYELAADTLLEMKDSADLGKKLFMMISQGESSHQDRLQVWEEAEQKKRDFFNKIAKGFIEIEAEKEQT